MKEVDGVNRTKASYLLDEYARLLCLKSRLWHWTSKRQAFGNSNFREIIGKYSDRAIEILKEYQKLTGNVLVVRFSGYHEGMDHHIIADYIRQDLSHLVEIGNISTDCEMGGFFASSTQDSADILDSYLKSRFPGLDYDRELSDPEDWTLFNWTDAEKYCKDSKIYVGDFEIPTIYPKPDEEIQELLTSARDSLVATGLPFEEAIKRLKIEMEEFS